MHEQYILSHTHTLIRSKWNLLQNYDIALAVSCNAIVPHLLSSAYGVGGEEVTGIKEEKNAIYQWPLISLPFVVVWMHALLPFS